MIASLSVRGLDVAALVMALLSRSGYVAILVILLPWLTYKVYRRGGWLSKAHSILSWVRKTVERALTLGERIADALEGRKHNKEGGNPTSTGAEGQAERLATQVQRRPLPMLARTEPQTGLRFQHVPTGYDRIAQLRALTPVATP